MRRDHYAKKRRRETVHIVLVILLACALFFGFIYGCVWIGSKSDQADARVQSKMVEYSNRICGEAPFQVENEWREPWKVRCKDGTVLLIDWTEVQNGQVPAEIRK